MTQGAKSTSRVLLLHLALTCEICLLNPKIAWDESQYPQDLMG